MPGRGVMRTKETTRATVHGGAGEEEDPSRDEEEYWLVHQPTYDTERWQKQPTSQKGQGEDRPLRYGISQHRRGLDYVSCSY